MAFVNYERKGNIVIITLNRPDRLNAIGREIIAGVRETFWKFEYDPDARVAILTGSGRAFSAGADLKDAPDRKPGETSALAGEAVGNVTKPVIAAVNGVATGGGCALAMACDLIIAAESATLGMAEVKVAVPAGPEMFLARGISLYAAMEIVLLGDLITAQRAYDIGLVNKVVPDEELMPAAMKIAEKITELSPRITSLIKQAAVKAVKASRKTFGERSPEEQARMFSSEDRQEAMRAFTEKRKPVF